MYVILLLILIAIVVPLLMRDVGPLVSAGLLVFAIFLPAVVAACGAVIVGVLVLMCVACAIASLANTDLGM